MSLTEALRAGAPQAFGALYDEYAGALYAYCCVMVGDEAGDALCDAFVTVARDPGAAPDDDAELPVWLYSLARAECVRRGALERGIVTTMSADPLRRVLALLTPEDREVLALSNALDSWQIGRVLGVPPDTAETVVQEAKRRLVRAAASEGGREPSESAMLAPLSGEALHRLVTLGYEPPVGQRGWVLSACAAAGHGPGAAVSGAGGTPLPLDPPSVSADEAITHQFPRISLDGTDTASLRQADGTSGGARQDRSWPGDHPFFQDQAAEPTSSESVQGEQARFHGTHAKQRKPLLPRRVLAIVGLGACIAAATGTALAWPGSDQASSTGPLVRQTARPSRPVPSAGQVSVPPRPATPSPDAAPAPTGTAVLPKSTAPSGGKAPARSSRPKPTHRPHRPKPPPTEPAPPTETTPPTQTTPPTETSPSTEPTPPAETTPPTQTSPPTEPPHRPHRPHWPRRPHRPHWPRPHHTEPAPPTETAVPAPRSEPSYRSYQPHRPRHPRRPHRPQQAYRPHDEPAPPAEAAGPQPPADQPPWGEPGSPREQGGPPDEQGAPGGPGSLDAPNSPGEPEPGDPGPPTGLQPNPDRAGPDDAPPGGDTGFGHRGADRAYR